ncbi:protein GAMETOPHYTE DEFECTIVE 1 isoform X2 [Cucumis sativus]|uniref:protein GAMETOPHYTE DEFECTIVE 1 isoform X2 n=1 Tax=Cucumis sativus TaxID=3659 RepID=UPI0005EC5959|nr:protein GAMETOPHYTE DEFECTIVE 1 isoform X2 [Cucumis sativus]
MGFFDLNIPYDDRSSSSSANRIKVVAKIMELGYSGIAYNRTIKGVMSDRDRCSIPLLKVSSLHTILPSFSASVEFHRDLLDIPRSSPFRQYTRLTISINTNNEVLAVNSGNLILKTYDLIAVKPLNQYAFEQACEKLEIDIIAIDFAEKLPFRLKQGSIISAIKRGVYFEIMYSDLLSDVHERRQMISTAKVLVDWTNGKNLILSSAAPSVNEIRGPYDVANLSSLLGVSMECAKAAVSKNCRNLIANALKRKQFYKETIRVERISSDDKLDLDDPWSVDLLKWDPMSSGEGDLLLDDIAKSFAASNERSKNVKSIDFTSIVDNLPSQGFLVKNVIECPEAKLSLNDKQDLWPVTDAIEPQIAVNGVIQQSHTLAEEHRPLSDRLSSIIESSKISHSHGNAEEVPSNSEEEKNTINEIVQPEILKQEEPIEKDVDNLQSKNLTLTSELNVVSTNELVHSPTSTKNLSTVVFENDRTETLKMENVDFHQNEYGLENSVTLSDSENVCREKNSSNLISEDQKHATMVVDGTLAAEECLHSARLGEPADVAIAEDQVSPLDSCTNDTKDDYQQTSEVFMDDQESGDADPQITQQPSDQPITSVISTGKCQSKRERYHPASKLPLQRLINPLPFKKACKRNTEKCRSKRRRHHLGLLLPFKRSINHLAFKKARKTKC